MANNTHVAFYIPALHVGGAQQVTVNVANGLAERGVTVDIVLSYGEGLLRAAVSDKVTIIDLETPHILGIGIGASIPVLRRYLHRREPSILFSAMTFANVIAICACRIADTDTTVVAVEHDTFSMQRGFKQRLVSNAAKHLLGSTDCVVAVSEGVKESIVEKTVVDPEMISVLHNPICIDEIRVQAQETVKHRWLDSDQTDVVLSVGRLEPQKDLDTLLRAFALVRKERPQAKLIIAGDGSQRHHLESVADKLGIADDVSFSGYVENVYGYMSRADVFVLSSKHEGLPSTLIEALACGCPVVSTDCPSGPREILEGGVLGPLVPVGDEQALAEAVHTTLDDPTNTERLRSRAEEFSMNAVIDDYLKFVREHATRAQCEHRTALNDG